MFFSIFDHSGHPQKGETSICFGSVTLETDCVPFFGGRNICLYSVAAVDITELWASDWLLFLRFLFLKWVCTKVVATSVQSLPHVYGQWPWHSAWRWGLHLQCAQWSLLHKGYVFLDAFWHVYKRIGRTVRHIRVKFFRNGISRLNLSKMALGTWKSAIWTWKSAL